jgi:tape measure domain-containing protein
VVKEQLGSVVVEVGVDDRPLKAGLARARRDADTAGKGIESSLGGAISAIGNAAAAAGIGAVALQIGRIGIEADSAQTRLAALTGRFNETAQAQAVVSAAAKTLNLTQTEAASGFSQLYASLRPTGVSLQQIETIFVGVTAAAKNTGLSAGSVSAALAQLTQGLASGRLQGDELRSVMEQLPPLSQAIARTMAQAGEEVNFQIRAMHKCTSFSLSRELRFPLWECQRGSLLLGRK